MRNSPENQVVKEPSEPISKDDAKRINGLGGVSDEIESFESSLENPNTLPGNDKEYIESLRQRLGVLKGNRDSLCNFSIGKIKNLPNSKAILDLVRKEDILIMAKYDKQTEELISSGVAATLMTPEEKQKYYDAQTRQSDFISYLRDNFGIDQSVGKNLYEEIARRSTVKYSEANISVKSESAELKNQEETQNKFDEGRIRELRIKLGISSGENKMENEIPTIIDSRSGIKSFEKGTPIDYVITKKGSIYKYLPDGRTQRFKKVEDKNYEPQDAMVFVPSWEWILKNKDKMPKEYLDNNVFGESEIQYTENLLDYVQKRTVDKESGKKVYIIDVKGNKLETNEDILKAGEKIFLWFGEEKSKDKHVEHFRIPVTTRPTVGYSTFDSRKYKKGDNWMREKHLGNEVIEIVRKTNGS